MVLDGGGAASGEVGKLIALRFGNDAGFREAFRNEAMSHFGSGRCWLVPTDGTLEITATHDADLPLAYSETALLTCDLWEHAYYLENLINWRFANQNLQKEMVI